MYRVDVMALAAWAAHVAGVGEDVAAAHLAADNRVAAAQPGWVGVSAVALDMTAAQWSQFSRRLLNRLGDHALEVADDGIRCASTDDMAARQLRGLGP